MFRQFCHKASKYLQRKNLLLFGTILLYPFCIFLVLNLIYPVPMDKLNRHPSVAVYSKDDELLTLYISDDGFWRKQTRIEEIPPFLQKSVLEYEDKYFYYHPGFNPLSLARAFFTNLGHGHVVCGGSTITMQVARMIEPKPRTYRSKIIEIFRALQLEFRFSKHEILEYYFNLAPYGGNLEGIGSAAYFYFGKSPDILDKSEMIALVGLPNSPTRLRPDLHNEAARNHRDKIAKLMFDRKLISEEVYFDVLSDEVPSDRFARPQKALHLARLVREKYREPEIKTTIDLKTQTFCEKAVRKHLESLTQDGITNGAVIVIDNKTRSLRAMVGSRDFFDSIHEGQVNGAIAPRSPGSSLKPFAYALALDDGIISPKMMLSDVPVNYSGYSPINYDKQYRGGIPAEEALKLSLNVPAVYIYSKLGDSFYSFLKKGGFTTLTRPRDYYGLPLVLGSSEANLLELTNLYATLACKGEYRSCRMTESETPEKSVRILSDASSYIISEILSDVRRPELPDCWESTTDLPKVAWKTGTSYGNRDAWCIGYNPDYTVGVWLGNFSGKEANKLVGVGVAAPLMFDIFNSITTTPSWFEKPESVGTRQVCSISGLIKSKDCPGTTEELFIHGVSPIQSCQMHRKFAIDDETGMRLASEDSPGREYSEKLFEIWPPDIASWRKRQGYPIAEIPPLMSNVSHFSSGPKPLILSPQTGTNFVLREDAPIDHQRILLEASASNMITRLFWFVDGELIETCKPDERPFYYPRPGKHKIVCMDSEGNSSTVIITINSSEENS